MQRFPLTSVQCTVTVSRFRFGVLEDTALLHDRQCGDFTTGHYLCPSGKFSERPPRYSLPYPVPSWTLLYYLFTSRRDLLGGSLRVGRINKTSFIECRIYGDLTGYPRALAILYASICLCHADLEAVGYPSFLQLFRLENLG